MYMFIVVVVVVVVVVCFYNVSACYQVGFNSPIIKKLDLSSKGS